MITKTKTMIKTMIRTMMILTFIGCSLTKSAKSSGVFPIGNPMNKYYIAIELNAEF